MDKIMTVLARGLPSGLGAFDTLHPRESLFKSGNIAATNGEVITPSDGCSIVSLLVSGAYAGTLVVEGSIDEVNWDAIPIKPINNGGAWALSLVTGAVGRWQGPVGPFRHVRVRASTLTSGQASVVLSADNGVFDVVNTPKPSDLCVTNIGAAGAAITLTLPAAGVGMYHHINRILIQRFAAATLVAAATPVNVTTGNLSGARVFSMPAEAAAQGTLYSEIVEPAKPIRSTSANTATTFVAPATTNVIWRLTADYDVAPHG